MPRLGQHFLTDPHYLERIVEAASIAVGDHVLEIGPGRGHLTQRLLDAGAHVTAIELDRHLARELDTRIQASPDTFTLQRGDAAQTPWPDFDKLVANLPYQISSPVLFRLLDTDYEEAILTVQKEFAERLAAELGTKHVSRLTIKVALHADARILFLIPPGAFTPPPEIESAVIRITPKPGPDVTDADLLEELIDHAFAHRRKMLRSSLKAKPGAGEALESLGIETKRPAKLMPQDWVKLANRVADLREDT